MPSAKSMRRVNCICRSMEVSLSETCSLNPNPEQQGILKLCRLTNETSLEPGSLFGVLVPGLNCEELVWDLHVWTDSYQGYCIQFGHSLWLKELRDLQHCSGLAHK